MKCIEAQQLVKPYLEKQLSDRQLEQFLEHVDHCPECYDELEIYFSIYETLEDSGTGQDADEYDFKGKLNQDIKNAKRYLRVRKAYRFFRFAIVLIAELLLICTVITGLEMQGEEGSRGTTVYRVIYGQREKPEPVPENLVETEENTGASEKMSDAVQKVMPSTEGTVREAVPSAEGTLREAAPGAEGTVQKAMPAEKPEPAGKARLTAETETETGADKK